MPAFTYLHDSDYCGATQCPALDEAIQELRMASGEDWRVCEALGPIKRHGFLWLRKRRSYLYQLLCGVGDGEFQIINFWRDHSWSINHYNSAETVIAYIYGQLAEISARNRGHVRPLPIAGLIDAIVKDVSELDGTTRARSAPELMQATAAELRLILTDQLTAVSELLTAAKSIHLSRTSQAPEGGPYIVGLDRLNRAAEAFEASP